MATLERRVALLEVATMPDNGPVLIMVMGVSCEHREMGSAVVRGETVKRLETETEDAFLKRVGHLALEGHARGTALVFVNELDARV